MVSSLVVYLYTRREQQQKKKTLSVIDAQVVKFYRHTVSTLNIL